MIKFLELEGGYLIIALFILAITLFVTTRPYVANGKLVLKGMVFVSFVLAGFILAHYFVTTTRMQDVKSSFLKNKIIICESREVRKVAQSIIIDPSKQNWVLDGDVFRSPSYNRAFHTARCIVK